MAEIRRRHWSLTGWLILMIVVNSIVALSTLIAVRPSDPLALLLHMLVFTCIGIANVVFSVVLLCWKKWAFFGLVGTSILLVLNNLILMHTNRAHLTVGRVLLPLLWVVVLYGLLQIGKEKSGWTQLE